MRISRTSPGAAPRTPIGPVRMCPGIRRCALAWTSRSSGGTVNPSPGRFAGPPESDSIVTWSPLSTVRTCGSAASNQPQWTVSGVDGRRWCMPRLCHAPNGRAAAILDKVKHQGLACPGMGTARSDTVDEPLIEDVRRFNRLYTKTIGVLEEGMLQTPFSLQEARVIYELGK